MLRAALPILIALSLAGCRRHHAAPKLEPMASPVVAPAFAPAPVYAPPPPPPPPAPANDRAAWVGGGAGTMTHVNALGGARDGGGGGGGELATRSAAFDAVVRAALPSVQRCFDGMGSVPFNVEVVAQVSYRVQPSGRTSRVDVGGDLPRDTLACIHDVVDALRFPPFQGDPVSGSFPFRYHREPPRP